MLQILGKMRRIDMQYHVNRCETVWPLHDHSQESLHTIFALEQDSPRHCPILHVSTLSTLLARATCT